MSEIASHSTTTLTFKHKHYTALFICSQYGNQRNTTSIEKILEKFFSDNSKNSQNWTKIMHYFISSAYGKKFCEFLFAFLEKIVLISSLMNGEREVKFAYR